MVENPIDWKLVQQEFIDANLDPTRHSPFTLKDLSDLRGIDYQYMRNVAAKERWKDVLREKLEERREEVRKMVLDAQVEGEIEVRVRQAGMSRLAASKAMLKLQGLEPESLTVDQAIKLWDIAMTQERKALGLADNFTAPVQGTSEDKRVSIAVQTAMNAIKRLRERKEAAALEAPRERVAS